MPSADPYAGLGTLVDEAEPPRKTKPYTGARFDVSGATAQPGDPYEGLGTLVEEADPYEGLGRPADEGIIAGTAGSFRRGVKQAGQTIDAASLAAAANLAQDADAEPARITREQNQDRPPDPANFQPGGPGIGAERGYRTALEKWRAREERRQERMRSAAKAGQQLRSEVLPAFVEAIDRRTNEIAVIPQAAGKEEYDAAKGFVEKLKVAARHPVDVIAGLSAESLPASAPALALGAAGSIAGPLGTATGAGIGSFAMEAGATILDQIAKTPGVDMKRPETVVAVLADPEKLAEIRTKAVQRGVGVGVFDALSAGIAGRLMRTAAKTRIGRAGQAAAEMGVQGALGGSGEVAGSITSGQDIDWGDVLSEVLGEAGGGTVEIATGLTRDRMSAPDASRQREGETERGGEKAKTDAQWSATTKEAAKPLTTPVLSGDLAAQISASLPDDESRDVLAGRSAQAEAAKLKTTTVDFGKTVQSVVDTLLAKDATPAQLDALDFQLRTLAERAGKRTRLKPEQVNASLGATFLIEALPAAEVFPLVSKLAEDTANVEALRAGLAAMRGSPPLSVSPSPPLSVSAPAGALTPEQRAAKVAELKAREVAAAADKAQADVDREAARVAALAVEKAKTRRIRDETKDLAQQEATGRDPATGRIVDLTRVPDAEIDLLDLAKEGVTEAQLEAEMDRRYRAAERAQAQTQTRGEDLLVVLRRVKLPTTDTGGLVGELAMLLDEHMTPRQRLELTSAKLDSLDRTAETLRDLGFNTAGPAEVIDLVERRLRGEEIYAKPTEDPQVKFARRETATVEEVAPAIEPTRAGTELLRKRMVAARETGNIRSYMGLRRRWIHSMATIDARPKSEQTAVREIEVTQASPQTTPNPIPATDRGADRAAGPTAAPEPTPPPAEVAPERPGRGLTEELVNMQGDWTEERFPGSPAKPEALRARPMKEIEAALSRGAAERDQAARAVNSFIDDQDGKQPSPTRIQWDKRTGAAHRAALTRDEAHSLARAIEEFDQGTDPFVWPSETLRTRIMPVFFRRSPSRREAAARTRHETRWWENLRLMAPAVAQEFELRFGDPAQLVKAGEIDAADLTGEEEAAYLRQRQGAMRGILFLFEGALRSNTDDVTRLNLLHEMGHAFWDTLPRDTQAALRAQWREEMKQQTGPLFDDEGNMRPHVARDVETDVQEWFAERLAHANTEWSQRRLEARAKGDTLLRTIAAEFRALLLKLREYIERAFGKNGYDDALTGDFRKFLDQGVRWNQPQSDPAGGTAEAAPAFARREGAPIPQAWPVGVRDAVVMSTGRSLKAHQYYDAAKAGSDQHAWFLVHAMIDPGKLAKLHAAHPNAILAPITAEERSGSNRIPAQFASLAKNSHPSWTVDEALVQTDGAGHTGETAAHRMATPAEFAGPVESGREYIILDDFATSGATVNALRAHLEANGGKVVAVAVLSAAHNPQTGYGGHLAPRPAVLKELAAKFNHDTLTAWLREKQIAHEPEALTNSQASYLLTFATLDRARRAIDAAAQRAESANRPRDIRDDARAEESFGRPPPRRADQDELRFARREEAPDPRRDELRRLQARQIEIGNVPSDRMTRELRAEGLALIRQTLELEAELAKTPTPAALPADPKAKPAPTPEQLLRDFAGLEQKRDQYLDEGNRVPRHILTGLADLREALENALPGWADRLREMKAEKAVAATAATPPEAGASALFPDNEGAIDPQATAAKRSQLEASTLRRPNGVAEWLASLKRLFTDFKSAIPELPGGASGRVFMRFRQGYRMLKAATDYVRKDAEERIAHIVEPLATLGKTAVAANRYHELQELQHTREKQLEAGEKVNPKLTARIAAIEAELESVPYHLFRKIVLYRDLYFRSRLTGPAGDPLTLPFSLTQGEVETTLRDLHHRLGQSPHHEAIEESLRRHYSLIKETRDGLLARGYIIPEELRNPLYFPHLVLDKTSTRLQRVKLDTADDFRGYLQQLVGTDRAIDTDYVQAMYHHLATVEAHNARQDIVEKYWQPYDIKADLEREARTMSEERTERGEGPMHWRQLVPVDHVVMTVDDRIPLRPELIINRQVLADRLGVALGEGDLQAQLRDLGMAVTLTAEDFKMALAAGEKTQWVVPKPVADAMHGIMARETRTVGLVEKVVVAPQSLWKRWILFAPHNVIRYTYGNLVSDIEKLFSADPAVFRKLLPAFREVHAFYQGETPGADLKEAFRRGVIDGVTAGEVTDLAAQQLDRFEAFLTSREHFTAMMKRGLGWGVTVNRVREAAFRYAKFTADLERMRAGADPRYAGAFNRDVRAIKEETPAATQYAQAAEISRKTFGDYQDISVSGDGLRRVLMPFYSWTEVNFRYHVNLFRNLGDMTAGAGLAQIARQSASAASRVLVARSVTGVLLRLALPYVAAAMWNNSDDREELEKTLSDEDRRRFHIILGKDAQGRTRLVYAPTALSDFMRWMGGNDFARLAAEYARGDLTFPQLAHEWASNLPDDLWNNVVQSIGPVFKAGWTAAFRKQTFPDALDQRSIPDYDLKWAVLGNMMDNASADGIRRVFDKHYYSPRTAADWAQQVILQVRRRDPESWGYTATMDRVAAYQAAHGGTSDPGVNNRADAQILMSFRRAIRAADVPAAVSYYQKLLDAGYTQERFRASIDHAEPLATLKKESRQDFVNTLSPAEREDLRNAYKFAARVKDFEPKERVLFPSKNATPAYRQRFATQGGRADVFAGVMQGTMDRTDDEDDMRAEQLLKRALQKR